MNRIDPTILRDRVVLVVGANGFLGRHLVRSLAGCGARVTAVSRSVEQMGVTPDPVDWRRCDASDPDQVSAAFREVRPELVYQLTSDSRGGRELALVSDSIRNDVLATTTVLTEAVRWNVARVVMTGSQEEPEGSVRDAVPASPYAAAKSISGLYARMFAALYDLPVTVLRLAMTYGPGQKDYKVIPYTIRCLLAERIAELGSGERMLDWVYVDDVTDAFVRAGVVATAGSCAIDIGTGRVTRLRDVLTMIGSLMGRPDLLAFGAAPDRKMEREIIADPRGAAAILGWSAQTALRDGLQRTIDSYAAIRESELR